MDEEKHYWARVPSGSWLLVRIKDGECRNVDGDRWPEGSFEELVKVPPPDDCKRARAVLAHAEESTRKLAAILCRETTLAHVARRNVAGETP